MDLDSKIAQAKARRDTAAALLTVEDKEEQAKREELAQVLAEAEKAESAKRDLDLDRRMDRAMDALGEAAKLKSLAIQEYEDTFIIQRNGKAHSAWVDALRAAGLGKKVDRPAADRKYAVAVVYDWNGETDFEKTDLGARLIKFLTDNPGVVSPIVDCASKLNGVFQEEQKS